MDNWMREYDELVGKVDELPELVRKCKKEPDDAHVRSALNRKMDIATTRCRMLQEDLEEMSRRPSTYHITEAEIRRRRALLEGLEKKQKQWQDVLRSQASLGGLSDRDELLGGGRTWGASESERTRSLDNAQLLAQQKSDMESQEERLKMLGESIGRQKDWASGISSELDTHVELLDRMDGRIDRTSQNVFRGTRQTDDLKHKRSTFSLWLVIFILFLIIVLLTAVPLLLK